MVVPSSITATTPVGAICVVRVGNDENGIMSPSSLSLPQTLCAVIDPSKVSTPLGSKSVAIQCEAFLIISSSGGLPGGMPPCNETSMTRVDCTYGWKTLSLPLQLKSIYLFFALTL